MTGVLCDDFTSDLLSVASVEDFTLTFGELCFLELESLTCTAGTWSAVNIDSASLINSESTRQ